MCGQLAHWSGYMAGLPCSPSTPLPHTHTKGRLPSYPSQPHLLSTYCVSGHVPHIGPLARAGRWSSEAGLGKPAPQDCHCSVRQTGKERSAPSVVSLPLGRGLSLSGTFSGPARADNPETTGGQKAKDTQSERNVCGARVLCLSHISVSLPRTPRGVPRHKHALPRPRADICRCRALQSASGGPPPVST